jgi:hypothetical protein
MSDTPAGHLIIGCSSHIRHLIQVVVDNFYLSLCSFRNRNIKKIAATFIHKTQNTETIGVKLYFFTIKGTKAKTRAIPGKLLLKFFKNAIPFSHAHFSLNPINPNRTNALIINEYASLDSDGIKYVI